ncbi:MAG: amidohydrolase [Proteobacteria bacterium]|nr:amidohydrolase [Pseudomonadota bacterium]
MKKLPYLLSLCFLNSFCLARVKVDNDLLEFYKNLHQNPELSLREEKTGATLAKALEKEGMKVTFPFGGNGVVGLFQNGSGKTVLLRADLDALPLTENTALPYASKKKALSKSGTEVGVMHACGHDVHMTNLLGSVRNLIKNRNRWKGTLIVIGQPAEEIGKGAENLISAGLLKKFPKPDYALAFHVDSHLPAGKIAYVSGPAMAAADSVNITFKGKGGHGALPQENIDPIVIASRFVLDLQTLISRERDPVEPSVISVGSIHCGSKHNITPETCNLELTVRSFTKKERTRLLDGIKRKAEANAMSSGAPSPVVEVPDEGTPSTVNDPALVSQIVSFLEKGMGKEAIVRGTPATVSEDFSVYGEAGIPSALLFLGSISEKRLKKLQSAGKLPSLHSPFYYPDTEETLATGIEAMTLMVEGLLPVN